MLWFLHCVFVLFFVQMDVCISRCMFLVFSVYFYMFEIVYCVFPLFLIPMIGSPLCGHQTIGSHLTVDDPTPWTKTRWRDLNTSDGTPWPCTTLGQLAVAGLVIENNQVNQSANRLLRFLSSHKLAPFLWVVSLQVTVQVTTVDSAPCFRRGSPGSRCLCCNHLLHLHGLGLVPRRGRCFVPLGSTCSDPLGGHQVAPNHRSHWMECNVSHVIVDSEFLGIVVSLSSVILVI